MIFATSRIRRIECILRNYVSTTHNITTQCSCGKSTLTAEGPPLFSAFFHRPEFRTTDTILRGTAFHGDQLVASNIIQSSLHDDILLACACEKSEVIGVDSMKTEGDCVLNHRHAVPDFERSPLYIPSQHLYYTHRAKDICDGLPKWCSGIGSKRVAENKNESIPAADDCVYPSPSTPQFTMFPIIQHTAAPKTYNHTYVDPARSVSLPISSDILSDRLSSKYIHSSTPYRVQSSNYDTIIIGGGHNALTTAAYLAQEGIKPLVLERRPVVGGAAVTEEIVPGFLFSRASYLAGLLRPQLISELGLHKYGFKYIARDPSSFTPTLPTSSYGGKHLLLGADAAMNYKSIAQFSVADAEAYGEYEEYLNNVRSIIDPFLDMPPVLQRSPSFCAKQLSILAMTAYNHGRHLTSLYEIMTTSASDILDKHFESDILKSTLVTDAIIGSLISPCHPGSGYVLLHHVMGQAAGSPGTWAYVEGGMGAVSNAIAAKATALGAEICTNASVKQILTCSGRAVGVEMMDGQKIFAKKIVSGATPYHTFIELLPSLTADNPLPSKFVQRIRHAGNCTAIV